MCGYSSGDRILFFELFILCESLSFLNRTANLLTKDFFRLTDLFFSSFVFAGSACAVSDSDVKLS